MTLGKWVDYGPEKSWLNFGRLWIVQSVDMWKVKVNLRKLVVAQHWQMKAGVDVAVEANYTLRIKFAICHYLVCVQAMSSCVLLAENSSLRMVSYLLNYVSNIVCGFYLHVAACNSFGNTISKINEYNELIQSLNVILSSSTSRTGNGCYFFKPRTWVIICLCLCVYVVVYRGWWFVLCRFSGYILNFVLAQVYYIVMVFFSWLIILILSLLAKRLAGKSISDMTYLVSSGTLNLNSSNQSVTYLTSARQRETPEAQSVRFSSTVIC